MNKEFRSAILKLGFVTGLMFTAVCIYALYYLPLCWSYGEDWILAEFVASLGGLILLCHIARVVYRWLSLARQACAQARQ